MPLAALDTNVLLRLVVRDPLEQYERVRELLAMPRARFRVSDYAFIELVFALDRYYDLSRDQIADTVLGIVAIDTIECNGITVASAVEFWRTHPKLSFEDCLMAEDAESHDAVPLWTFDHKLANQHSAAKEVPSLSR